MLDRDNLRARAVSPSGATTTVAGSGEKGHLDGPAAEALFKSFTAVSIQPSGLIAISDWEGNRIRTIAPIPAGGPSSWAVWDWYLVRV